MALSLRVEFEVLLVKDFSGWFYRIVCALRFTISIELCI